MTNWFLFPSPSPSLSPSQPPDEHERIQKKVFTNWINYYVPNCIEKDIINELRDGTKLIKLIEALTGDQLQCEKGKKLRRVHFISNVNKVLNYLEKRKVTVCIIELLH